MTKTLKDFLDEATGILKVKNPDEQKFIDKHQVQRTNDRNGNDDDVFGGSKQKKVKAIDRRKERHGYNPGEDESVYEDKVRVGTLAQRTQAYRDEKAAGLKGNQHKIDANKNGKVDAQDFKLLRKNKKKVAEEAEQIDELSPATLGSYIKKATKQIGSKNFTAGYHSATTGTYGSRTDRNKEREELEKADKRERGVRRAVDKLTKEETEQVDEVLTAKTPMGTWIKDFQTSRNPKFKGKSQTKRREMAIAAKLSAERGGKKLGEDTDQIDEAGYSAKAARAGKDIGKPGKQFSKIAAKAAAKYGSAERGRKVAGAVLAKLRKEDRLVELLSNLPESTRDIMLETFAKLNEDNQYKFIATCETEEGIDQMLNFSIMNRGK